MDYTTNYHLPQWEDGDRIMRTDFNQMCADMETGLTENRAATATAQTTAEAAAALPYVVGAYEGIYDDQTIEVGFQPSLVIIIGDTYRTDQTAPVGLYSGVFDGGNKTSNLVRMVPNGFWLLTPFSNYPNVNKDNHRYSYIAFR